MEFASKAYFLLLLLLIPYILWYFLYRKKNEPTMRLSDTRQFAYAPKSLRQRLVHLPMMLRCLCFVLIVCAMARPQTHNSWDNKMVEGIDIMIDKGPSARSIQIDLNPFTLIGATTRSGGLRRTIFARRRVCCARSAAITRI